MIKLKTPGKILINGIEYKVSDDSTITDPPCLKCGLSSNCGNISFCYKFRMKGVQYFKKGA